MQINSIDTFLGVKGGYNNGQRDVYFVRALGEGRGLADAIYQADKRMCIEMSRSRLWYVRLQSLPQLCEAEDVSFYSKVYEEWKQSGKIRLRQMISSEVLERVMSAGLAEVLAKHRTYKQAVSDSMLKNFAAKILFFVFSKTDMRGQHSKIIRYCLPLPQKYWLQAPAHSRNPVLQSQSSAHNLRRLRPS